MRMPQKIERIPIKSPSTPIQATIGSGEHKKTLVLGRYWRLEGKERILSPPPLIDAPHPGDIFSHIVVGDQESCQLWLGENDGGWKPLPSDIGTDGPKSQMNTAIKHPTESDRWLKFSKGKKESPTWVKWESIKRADRVRARLQPSVVVISGRGC